MNNTEHVYVPPSILTAGGTPTDSRTLLNGEDLLSKTQALRLSTSDSRGKAPPRTDRSPARPMNRVP